MKKIIPFVLWVSWATLGFAQQIITYNKSEEGILFYIDSDQIKMSDYKSYLYPDVSPIYEKNGLLYYTQPTKDFILDSIQNRGVSIIKREMVFLDRKKDYSKDTLKKSLKPYECFFKSPIKKAMVCKEGSYWVATADSGIFHIVGKSITRFSVKNGLPSNKVDQMILDARNNLVVTTNKGISRYQNGIWNTFSNFQDGKKIKRVQQIEPFNNGDIHFLTSANRLGYSTGDQYQHRDIAGKVTGTGFKDSYNNRWYHLANYQGLVCIKKNKEILVFREFPEEGCYNIRVTYLDSKENTWLINKESVGIIRKGEEVIEWTYLGKLKDSLSIMEGTHRFWIKGAYGTAYYDYSSDELVNLNDRYGFSKQGADVAGEVLVRYTDLGVHDHTINSHSKVIANTEGNAIYTQYNVSEKTTGVVLGTISKYQDHTMILLVHDNKEIDIKNTELLGQDTRVLSLFCDSEGNFWLDTPTQIHKITLN